MLWTAPTTGIAMCQSAVAIEEQRESAFGYTQTSQAALRHGEITPESRSRNRFRLLYAQLRTSLRPVDEGEL